MPSHLGARLQSVLDRLKPQAPFRRRIALLTKNAQSSKLSKKCDVQAPMIPHPTKDSVSAQKSLPHLAQELWVSIFSELDLISLWSCCAVSHRFRDLSHDILQQMVLPRLFIRMYGRKFLAHATYVFEGFFPYDRNYAVFCKMRDTPQDFPDLDRSMPGWAPRSYIGDARALSTPSTGVNADYCFRDLFALSFAAPFNDHNHLLRNIAYTQASCIEVQVTHEGPPICCLPSEWDEFRRRRREDEPRKVDIIVNWKEMIRTYVAGLGQMTKDKEELAKQQEEVMKILRRLPNGFASTKEWEANASEFWDLEFGLQEGLARLVGSSISKRSRFEILQWWLWLFATGTVLPSDIRRRRTRHTTS